MTHAARKESLKFSRSLVFTPENEEKGGIWSSFLPCLLHRAVWNNTHVKIFGKALLKCTRIYGGKQSLGEKNSCSCPKCPDILNVRQKTLKANHTLSKSTQHGESLRPGNLLDFNISEWLLVIAIEQPTERAEKTSLFHHVSYSHTFVFISQIFISGSDRVLSFLSLF